MKKNKKLNIEQKKILKWLKIVIILCIAIIAIEGIYIGFKIITKNSRIVYVDTMDDFDKVSDGYIACGSSDFKNSEFNSYEEDYLKAKFTKYNEDFEVIFESNYTKGYESYFTDVSEYADGYIAVGGAQYSKQQVEDNATDGLIVLYDKNGEMKDSKSLQISGDTTFTKVLVLDDGFIVIGQSILENMVLGTDPKGGALMIKYTFDLEEVWRTNYGGSKSAIFNDILIDNGYIYLVGKDASRYGMFLKYTLDGEQLYVKTYEYTDVVGFSSITKLGDSFIVGGAKTINIDAEDADKVVEALILKYDSEGNILDEATYSKNDYARFNKVIVDDGEIVAVGHTYLKDEEESTDTYNVLRYSGIFVKLDTDLNITVKKQEKGSRDNYFSDILVNEDGYLIGGQTTSKELGANNKDYRTYFLQYNKDGKKEWYK